MGLFVVSGCGKPGPEKLVPVEGVVMLDSVPLPAGAVDFIPDATKGNLSNFVPSALLGPGGTYKLQTEQREGASPGWYKVTVRSLPPTGTERNTVEVPGKYQDANKTDLRVEVVEAPAADAYKLTLSSKGAK